MRLLPSDNLQINAFKRASVAHRPSPVQEGGTGLVGLGPPQILVGVAAGCHLPAISAVSEPGPKNISAALPIQSTNPRH